MEKPDPLESPNLYGFCGNDGVNRFDVFGHSWLSKLWDRTILSLGKHIAQNWNHGRQYIEMAAAIVASIWVGWEVADWVYEANVATIATDTAATGFLPTMTITANTGLLGGAVGSGAISAGVATTFAGVAGGAAGGFVSGVSLGAMSGQNLGQALQSGLQGAEYGAIQAGITAGFNELNNDFSNVTKVKTFSLNLSLDIKNLIPIAVHGFEGAITNELEHKDPTSGFWSQVYSQIGMGFDTEHNLGWLAKGVVSGAGSIKSGSGFMSGFWSAEANAATSYLSSQEKNMDVLDRDMLGIVQKGLAGGAISRFARKTFAAGLFPAAGGEALNDVLSYLEGFPDKGPSPAANGAASSAFKLLQPKVTKKGVSIPLDTLQGGSWANGANWAQLY